MAGNNQEVGHLVWRRFAELAGDRAMVARMHILHRAREAGLELTLTLTDGSLTRIPEMVAAEAAVGALDVSNEDDWRREWTKQLVGVAVKWQDKGTEDGVVAVLNNTDRVIRELKTAGVWPWGSEQDEKL